MSGPRVDPSAYEKVGQVTRRYVSDPVSLRHIREYLAGTGDDSRALPAGDDEDGIAAVIAPPLFFLSACRQVVGADRLEADGQHRGLGVDGVSGQSMMAGSAVEFFGAVRVGDVLHAVERLVSIVPRTGRSGALVFVQTSTEYTNRIGDLVARYDMTVVFR